MSDLIRNERTELTATWVNSVATAAVALGVIGPFIATFTTSLPVPRALALA